LSKFLLKKALSMEKDEIEEEDYSADSSNSAEDEALLNKDGEITPQEPPKLSRQQTRNPNFLGYTRSSEQTKRICRHAA
jgi:hypothetical protein